MAKSRTRVLVIEDEAALRDAVVEMLRMEHFDVLEASDGLSAVNLLRERSSVVDVILLDVTLPGICGREIFEELRKICPHAKVLATTAFDEQSARSSFAPQKPDGFIRKPYKLTELMTELRRMQLVGK